MKLQNKRIKNVQIQIFRHITLIDIPVIIVLFLVSASIGFALPENLFILVKMLISTAFFLVWTVPLIKYYKNWGLKGYKIIWYIALYFTRPKVYSKISSTSANTRNLLPYSRAKQDFIKISGGFIAGIEIYGQDIFSIGSQKIEQILEQFTTSLNAVNSRISIVKIAHPNDLTKNKLFFYKIRMNAKPIWTRIFASFTKMILQILTLICIIAILLLFMKKMMLVCFSNLICSDRTFHQQVFVLKLAHLEIYLI